MTTNKGGGQNPAPNKNEALFNPLPTEIVNTSNIKPTEYINSLLTGNVPKVDLETYTRTNFVIPKTNFRRKKNSVRKIKSYITRKEKQQLGLLKCPKTGWNYNDFEELRRMWREYIMSHLGPRKFRTNINQQLSKADYHGAEMTVVRSKCPSLIGISGTCILDTKNTLQIVSQDNKLKIIPKKDSVFKIRFDRGSIIIYGKYLMAKSADRSVKKIKSHLIPDL